MRQAYLALILLLAIFGCSKNEDTGGSDTGTPAVDPARPNPVEPAKPEPVKPVDPSKPDESVNVVTAEGGRKYYTGLIHEDEETKPLGKVHVQLADENCENLPDNFDLRTLGLVPSVKDQSSCGSCWSFSMTGSLESALMGIGKTLNLSEQEMVSCWQEQWGCNGGLLFDFKYQITKGQSLETDFPYTARDTACKSGLVAAAKGASFAYVGSPSRGPTEKELKCALVKHKTIPWITVGATNAWGSPPASERTAYTRCGATQTNHAVGVVGYWKDGNGKTQFIMKNSWGTGWGDNGYMSLPLGCNSFGDEVAFIAIEKPPGPGPTPTPDPCTPPKIKLPAMVAIHPGDEVTLAVKSSAGWTFEWFEAGVKVAGANGPTLTISPTKDTVYKVGATSTCGTAESSAKVAILVSKKALK